MREVDELGLENKDNRVVLHYFAKDHPRYAQGESPGSAFVTLAERYNQSASSNIARYRERSNIVPIVHAAILSGLPFEIEDFTKGGFLHYSTSDGGYGEYHYALACEGPKVDGQFTTNVSARRSIEHAYKRPPLCFEGRPIFVGREFEWGEEKLKMRCTSFRKDGLAVYAVCESPRKRFWITLEQLRAIESQPDQDDVPLSGNTRVVVETLCKCHEGYPAALSPGAAIVKLMQRFAALCPNDDLKTWYVRRAIALAIKAGLPFSLEDFMEQGFLGYAAKTDPSPDREELLGEGFHKLSCGDGGCANMSACRSIEHALRRPPFVWEGTRVYVGRYFVWNGVPVACTAFTADGTQAKVEPRREDGIRGWFYISRQQFLQAEKKRTDPYGVHFHGTWRPKRECRWIKARGEYAHEIIVDCLAIDSETKTVKIKHQDRPYAEETLTFEEIRVAEKERREYVRAHGRY